MSEESGGGSDEFAVGSQVAGYRLEEQIGQGGMAVVFRAYDSRLDRHVALKILAPGLALDDAFRQRFIRESRAAAAVDDPHIIPVFEAGEERGVLFIAMRFVRGGDVRSLLDREGPLSPARATEIISQVASALDSAHARGLVHRDVKPANMLLDTGADSDRPDHVYLSDFGLTKASLAVTGLTSTGQFLGTLDYVAPEQVEGRPVDGRTDQYALACAAFELLTGAPPFRRDQGMAVMYAQVSESPPLLSSRRAGLPAGADTIMNRALAKTPSDRYPSCRAFAAALRRVFGLAADFGPQPQPPARPPTQIAGPRRPPPAAAGVAAADSGEGREHQEPPPGGPPTEAASYPAGRGTRPGQTEPPGGTGGSGGQVGGGQVGGGQVGGGQVGGGQGSGGQGSGGQSSGPDGAGSDGQPRRRWWRSPVPLAVVGAAVVIVAGGGYFVLGGNGSGSGDQVGATTLTVPGCTSSTPALSRLRKVASKKVKIGGTPFAVVESKDGTFTFATVDNGIAVLRNGSGLAPTFVRTIQVTGADKGMTRTSDGRYLLAAGHQGAVVIDIAEAEQGVADPVRGHLVSPVSNGGAVGVRVSPDDKFAFVTLQNTTKMAVFNLQKAIGSGFTTSAFVGFVPLGVQPVGIGESPDGKWLYATSFRRTPGTGPGQGTLSVISMHGAERKPGTSVVRTVDAGCSPARIVTSGNTIWVTARDSNAVLAFSASKLTGGQQGALIARVAVGHGPVGLTLASGGRQLVVADSNFTGTPGTNGELAVVSTSAALARKPALLGVVPASGQPRQLTLSAGGATLLATNQVTGLLQAVKVADLPSS